MRAGWGLKMIGKQIKKPVQNWSEYAKTAVWCNGNNAKIEEFQDHYEVVAIQEHVLTQEELLEQSKSERARAVENIKVTVDGMTFDGDEKSQERMARSVVALSDDEMVTWVLADNTVAQVTKSQLLTALRLAGEEQTRLWTVPYDSL